MGIPNCFQNTYSDSFTHCCIKVDWDTPPHRNLLETAPCSVPVPSPCCHVFVDAKTTSRCLLSAGPVVYVLDLADRLISKAGPFAAAGIMVGSIYWTAVTYGAVTVMQV